MMKAKQADWYRYGCSLDMKQQSWTEDTERQVAFLLRTLKLNGKERILDLACGYGRHALALAKRGFSVVGVDLTKELVEDAAKTARACGLDAQFVHADIRDIRYENEFDVVLNMADGAIGYLENDEENLKLFDVISRALKVGGKHWMDICNAEHAERYFPRTTWEIGERALALAQFDWNPQSRRMLFGGCDIPYGAPFIKPEIPPGDPTRLYCVGELAEIFRARNMRILETFSDYDGSEAAPEHLQLIVLATKSE